MKFHLISAFSARVSWEAGRSEAEAARPAEEEEEEEVEEKKKKKKTFSVQWRQGDLVKETRCEGTDVLLLNLEPGTSYEVRVLLLEGPPSSPAAVVSRGSFDTAPVDAPRLENLYESVRLADGTYDATQFDKEAHDVFLRYFSDVVKDGDTIFTSVVLKGAAKNIETKAVVEGSTVPVSGRQNLFLPFTTDSANKSQVVTLENRVRAVDERERERERESGREEEEDGDSAPARARAYAPRVQLTYTPADDSFVLGDRVLRVGDRFELFGRAVTVADGSIVLVFEDTVQLTYPFGIDTALRVTTTAGSQFSKNATVNVLNVVGTRTTGNAGSTIQSGWLYDSAADTIAEATRIVHTIDENGETGGMSIGVLHTDGASQAFIEPSLQLAPTSTTISVQNDSDQTVSATLNASGLSWDNENCAIYFGASQTFRIILLDEATAPILSIQSLDPVSGEYVSRAQFGDGS